MTDFNAVQITEHTLVGVGDQRPTAGRGNCFSVKSDEGKYYRIVNFGLENLEHLLEKGLKWPVKCRALGERTAIVHDGRIGERWYNDWYCTICCPQSLLPVNQRQREEREVMRGRRLEHDGCITFYFDRGGAEFE